MIKNVTKIKTVIVINDTSLSMKYLTKCVSLRNNKMFIVFTILLISIKISFIIQKQNHYFHPFVKHPYVIGFDLCNYFFFITDKSFVIFHN